MIDILILESDTVTASDLAFMLTGWGCRVAGLVSDHAGAIHFCEQKKVDLLIAETKIDGEPDGIETAYILQEIYDIPVIFTTSHIDSTTLTNTAKVDFTAYLIKPYRENDLLIMIRLAIAKYDLLGQTDQDCCGYVHDIHLNKVYCDEQEIILTAHEKSLFLLLFNERGTLVTHERIDEVIWSDEFVTDETRRQLVHRLKLRLPHDSIEIVRGLGYRFK